MSLATQPASSRGLGDTVAHVAKVTGIASAADAVSRATGVPCGCSERQATLNRWFPYQAPVDDFEALWDRGAVCPNVCSKESAKALWDGLRSLPKGNPTVLLGSEVAVLIADVVQAVCIKPGLDVAWLEKRVSLTRFPLSIVPRSAAVLAEEFKGSLAAVVVEPGGDAEPWRRHIIPQGILAVLEGDEFVIERMP